MWIDFSAVLTVHLIVLEMLRLTVVMLCFPPLNYDRFPSYGYSGAVCGFENLIGGRKKFKLSSMLI